ncbi:MAG: OsmC family protein [Deltaproteobacteria bacterium]|nr:OsmC family protein [Deltaproteobacteria bacterium]
MDVKIRYEGGLRFTMQARDHECIIDMPEAKGGTDKGPIPPEMIAGALGACVGIFIAQYCQMVGLPTEGLAVDTEFEYDDSDKPTIMTDIRVKVTLPAGIPEERLDAIQKVANTCIVHKTLLEALQMEIALVQPESE